MNTNKFLKIGIMVDWLKSEYTWAAIEGIQEGAAGNKIDLLSGRIPDLSIR